MSGRAAAIVAGMMEEDAFSRWLGIEVLDIGRGRARLRMRVRADMLNGFSRCHGGVTFAFADSALAFASNSRGRIAYSIESSIGYLRPVHEGEQLVAQAREESRSHRIGHYLVRISNEEGQPVGLFRGIVYRSSRTFEDAPPAREQEHGS